MTKQVIINPILVSIKILESIKRAPVIIDKPIIAKKRAPTLPYKRPPTGIRKADAKACGRILTQYQKHHNLSQFVKIMEQ